MPITPPPVRARRLPVAERLESRTLLATPRGALPTAYVPVDFQVGAITADPVANRVYLSDVTNGTLRVIDTDAAKQVGTIAVHVDDPDLLAVSPDGTRIVVGDHNSSSAEVFSTATRASVRTIDIGFTPGGLAIGVGDALYATAYNGIHAFDLATGAASGLIDVGSGGRLQTDRTGTRLYEINGADVIEYDVSRPSQLPEDSTRFFYTGNSAPLDAVVDRAADRLYTLSGGLKVTNMTTTAESYPAVDDEGEEYADAVARVEGKPNFFARTSGGHVYEYRKSDGQRIVRYDIGGDPSSWLPIAETPNGRLLYVSDFNGGDDKQWALGLIGAGALSIASGKATTVAGVAFLDTDLDGQRDANETGIANGYVYVDLNGNGVRDVEGAAEPSALIANAGSRDGSFLFTLPGAGTYTLRVDPGPAFGDGRFVLATNPSSLTFTVEDGGRASASIGMTYAGFVVASFFLDADGDGLRDPGEASGGHPDLYLDLNGNARPDADEPVQRWTADEDAPYSDLALYHDSTFFLAPAGTFDVRTLPGSAEYATRDAIRVSVVADESTAVAIGVSPPRTFSGRLFRDLDADGTRDADEGGYAGVTVWLDVDGDNRRDANEPSARTKSNGAFEIVARVPVQNAPIRYITPDGRLVSTAHRRRVTLQGATTAVRGDAGVYLPSSLSISAFFDRDKNRKHNKGDAWLANTIAFIDADNDGKQDKNERYVLTDREGNATFGDLAPGTYVIRLRPSSTLKADRGLASTVSLALGEARAISMGVRKA